MIRSVAASPLTVGSIMSIVTTSGRSRPHSCTASSPSSASPTTTSSGSAASDARRWCRIVARSEEHTSELQSRQYLVCRLLLEKKQKYISIELSFNFLLSYPLLLTLTHPADALRLAVYFPHSSRSPLHSHDLRLHSNFSILSSS